MARKGREHPVEAPPPAASSSDEDEEDDFDEEDQQSAPAPAAEEEEKQSSSSDEEEEEANREENSPSSPPPAKKGPTQRKPESTKPAESGSESDSDPEAPPKPTTDVANPKKPVSKPPPPASVTVLASPAPVAKRRGSENEKGTPKKVRREKVEGGGAAQDEGKKPLFQRLWNEDDEIAILQGMIEYKDKKGVDPMADADGFLEFIKKSLHVDVNRGQIVSKVRTLKKKFKTAKKKKKITGPHGVKVFDLSKRIWESDEVKNNGDDDRKDSNLRARNVTKRAGIGESLKGGEDIGAVLEDEKQEEGEERVKNLVISRGERELQLQDLGSFGLLNDGFLKEGMKFIDEGEKAKLEEKWREQNMAELEIYVERLDLIHELVQKTLHAIKST